MYWRTETCDFHFTTVRWHCCGVSFIPALDNITCYLLTFLYVSEVTLRLSLCLSVLRWPALLVYCLFWQPDTFLLFVCLPVKWHWRIKIYWLIDWHLSYFGKHVTIFQLLISLSLKSCGYIVIFVKCGCKIVFGLEQENILCTRFFGEGAGVGWFGSINVLKFYSGL